MRDRYTGNSNFEKTVTECVRRGGKKSSNTTMYAPGSKMAIKLQLWPNIGFNMYIVGSHMVFAVGRLKGPMSSDYFYHLYG